MLEVCRQYIKDKHFPEDVMIEAFTNVFQNLKNFKHEGSFEGWIRKITVNSCISYLRKKNPIAFTKDMFSIENEQLNFDNEINYDFDPQELIDTLP